MSVLLDVILPVFVIIGFGYLVARRGLFVDSAVDGVMRYAQSFALPLLLFKNVASLNLGTAFTPGLLLSFYTGAAVCYAFGFFGARIVFKRALPDAVAIGFACAFSNSLLLGVPITERAYGTEALAGNFAIISIHAPLIYTFGIVLMEWARARDLPARSHADLAQNIFKAVFTQPLVVGLLCGFAVNLSGLPQPGFLAAAVDMMSRSALPAALFGLGGVLWRYRPEGDKGLIAMVCFASLLLHPTIAYTLGRFGFHLDINGLRSVTVTAAMAPGVNAYMFAHMYGVGKRVNASAVLMATGLSIFTSWGWLHILP